MAMTVYIPAPWRRASGDADQMAIIPMLAGGGR